MELSELAINFSRSLLFALATLLPILNPPAVAPIFLSLTVGATEQARSELAKRVAVNLTIMLFAATIAGNVILSFFGISLPIVRIGGGLLVIATAWQLVRAADPDAAHAQKLADAYSYAQIRSKAFYPLTFPMICGPGAISAAITVGATLYESAPTAAAINLAGSLGAIVIASAVVYLCLRFAGRFLHYLGNNGTAVLMRLSAFILLCMGVQIVWNGLHELLLGLAHDILALT
jgi:multiple antibiotic resistance protein